MYDVYIIILIIIIGYILFRLYKAFELVTKYKEFIISKDATIKKYEDFNKFIMGIYYLNSPALNAADKQKIKDSASYFYLKNTELRFIADQLTNDINDTLNMSLPTIDMLDINLNR